MAALPREVGQVALAGRAAAAALSRARPRLVAQLAPTHLPKNQRCKKLAGSKVEISLLSCAGCRASAPRALLLYGVQDWDG